MGGAWFKLTLVIRGKDIVWDYFGCPEEAREVFLEIAKTNPIVKEGKINLYMRDVDCSGTKTEVLRYIAPVKRLPGVSLLRGIRRAFQR